jgi:hypothetical protein
LDAPLHRRDHVSGKHGREIAMAMVHTYKHGSNDGGTQDVTMFAIDHSVGRGGTNRKDDVQLIQILINRYIEYATWVVKAHPEAGRQGVLDTSGRQIAKLDVDGICGPLTLAAILATQRSLNVWRRITIDGRIDAIKEGGAAEYDDGKRYRFNTMYILAVGAEETADDYDKYAMENAQLEGEPLRPINVFDLPEPLKSSLLRSAMSQGIHNLVSLTL